jgi:hypothetical protein
MIQEELLRFNKFYINSYPTVFMTDYYADGLNKILLRFAVLESAYTFLSMPENQSLITTKPIRRILRGLEGEIRDAYPAFGDDPTFLERFVSLNTIATTFYDIDLGGDLERSSPDMYST